MTYIIILLKLVNHSLLTIKPGYFGNIGDPAKRKKLKFTFCSIVFIFLLYI